ncbi:helix-turn-helix transcriptional regulator [Agrobacterium rubi]|nr:helix-turn-helix transcriptional regulator [Agrobacterium rubi]NTF24900.1 helix-turn-helix transcriptional regulator [Agrobacterium rubi]
MDDTFEGSTLGERIRSARLAKGMSQGDLSRKSQVSQQLISRIESSGGGTRSDKLNPIAEALGCSPSSLDPHFGQGSRRVREAALRRRARPSRAADPELDSFLNRVTEVLEARLGFRPTPLQAVKYLAKAANMALD